MIYTLGCSFTKYYWPTWSEWLGHYTQSPVSNMAYPGFTNTLIYNQILSRYQYIAQDDTVYIMWTGANRNCSWYDQEWIKHNNLNSWFPDPTGHLWFTGQPWQGLYKTHPNFEPSLTHMLVDTFDIIFKTQKLLESRGCNYHMMFWQNPWLDTREQRHPRYVMKWNTKQYISKPEVQNAKDIMCLIPVQQLLQLIDWTKFIDAPADINDPATYRGLWEFLLDSKELVANNHSRDPHPNTLCHHDWTVQKIININGHSRSKAQTIADQAQNMVIPAWNSRVALDGENLLLNQYSIPVDQ